MRTQSNLLPSPTEFSKIIGKSKSLDYLILGKPGKETLYDPLYSSMSVLATITPTSSIASHSEARELQELKTSPEKLTKILDPIKSGNIPADIFDTIIDTNYKSLSEQMELGTIVFDSVSVGSEDMSLGSAHSGGLRSLTQANLGPECLLVCHKFLQEECSKTSCPYAHPGVRDASLPSVEYTRLAGSVRKVNYLFYFHYIPTFFFVRQQ